MTSALTGGVQTGAVPLEPLTPDEEGAWRALVRLMVVLPRAIDDDLGRRAGVGLTQYVVLMNLSEAADRQLSMSELAERSAISPSRMTRVIDALERDGMVVRGAAPDNHRISLARLTDTGLERLRAAWPEHLAGARELVMDHLAAAELAPFTDVVQRLIAAVERASGTPPAAGVGGGWVR